MLKSFKYRIYPKQLQIELIEKHIGAYRFIYNLALETKLMAYSGSKIKLTCFNLINQLPALKEECKWLKEISSYSQQQSVLDLDSAFTNFFKGQCNFPKFKKKTKGGSFRCLPRINDGVLNLPNFKSRIKIIIDRPFIGTIKQGTVSKTSTGKYFISVLCETGIQKPEKPKVDESKTIGIDLGLKSFLVTSDGQMFDNPKFLRNSLSKLKYTQSRVSRFKGKKNQQKLSLIHEKVRNQRTDFLHKVSIKLIRENQSIAIEDLNIKEMLKNHGLAQSISDAGWGLFVSMLEYKAEWYGNNILKIGRFDPSSKLCSNCGFINKNIKLEDREWICPKCQTKHDRDMNAALNIKAFAIERPLIDNKKSVEHRHKNQEELPTLVGALTLGISKRNSSCIKTSPKVLHLRML